jgi:hypothetical protein
MWPENYCTLGSRPLTKVLCTSLKDLPVTNKKGRLTKGEVQCSKIFGDLDFFLILPIVLQCFPPEHRKLHLPKAARCKKIISK